jgi:hypothetical protein
MSAIKLLEVEGLDDGTRRFQSQLEVGKDFADFIMGTDNVMKTWGYSVGGNVGFHEYNKPYEIVKDRAEMKYQQL